MDKADLVACAVVVVMTAGWLWFRAKTDRSVRTACLVLGWFQIVAGVCKLVLSGIYGDYAGFAVVALGVTMVVFRKGWTLLVMAAVFVLVGVVNIVTAFTQPHYTFILWGAVQLVIAALMVHFVGTRRSVKPSVGVPPNKAGSRPSMT